MLVNLCCGGVQYANATFVSANDLGFCIITVMGSSLEIHLNLCPEDEEKISLDFKDTTIQLIQA